MSGGPVIIGAGLSGLIAAHAWPRATVLEQQPAPNQMHRAVLRFRGQQVAALVGIEFTPVTVRKAIRSRGLECAPSIALANSYSRKVLGRVENDRSIWSLEPVTRWIAPDTLYEQLVGQVGPRIEWNETADIQLIALEGWDVVSTAPLAVAAAAVGVVLPFDCIAAPIEVRRYRIPLCDAYQTIYWPDQGTRLYRASVTRDLLIAELMQEGPEFGDNELELELMEAFGLDELCPATHHSQRYGKIATVPDDQRRDVLLQLTARHGVYSLGRFATWRNVLLDDLPHDIAVIKRLLLMGGGYAAAQHAAKGNCHVAS